MRYRDSFLVGSILLSAACGRTSLGTATRDGGMTSSGGAGSTGAMTSAGGATLDRTKGRTRHRDSYGTPPEVMPDL